MEWINMSWVKWTETAYFREDMAYAGKDHTNPRLKGFIAMGPFSYELRTGFKSLKTAMSGADRIWPMS